MQQTLAGLNRSRVAGFDSLDDTCGDRNHPDCPGPLQASAQTVSVFMQPPFAGLVRCVAWQTLLRLRDGQKSQSDHRKRKVAR